jgi:hypothetical protein
MMRNASAPAPSAAQEPTFTADELSLIAVLCYADEHASRFINALAPQLDTDERRIHVTRLNRKVRALLQAQAAGPAVPK